MGFARVVGAIIAGLGLFWAVVGVLYVCGEGGLSSVGASWYDFIGGLVLATGAIAFGLWLSGGARRVWLGLRSAIKHRHSLLESGACVIVAVTVGSFALVVALALLGAPESVVRPFAWLAAVGWSATALFLIVLAIRRVLAWRVASLRTRSERRGDSAG
jgi:hypothetical protein